jgi:serine/threonine protein kinase
MIDVVRPGQTIGPYRIVAEVGRGGMGVVFRAEDTRLARPVAIKVVSGVLGADSSAVPRFWQEARAVATLNHPNICTMYDVGEVDGHPYMVMELLDGISLKDRLASRAASTAELVRWTRQAASALDAAHAAGVIHRDIKPANLFLVTSAGAPSSAMAADTVKLLDFGLAKRWAASAEELETREALTSVGTTMGTVNYMSPEQVRAEPLDHRTDLFSFGAVVYEIAAGRKAFPGAMPEAFAAIADRDPPAD